MKKINFILIALIFAVSGACNIVDYSDKGQAGEYQFETDAVGYSLQDTVNASFTNLSGQRLVLHYQVCTIVGLQKWENEKWKSIPIPIYCIAIVREPVVVEPGETQNTGIALQIFDENEFEEGIYRLDISVGYPSESNHKKLTSNRFKIIK